MRAVIQKQYGDVNVLQMDDVVMPIRQSGEVLIRAVWTGVNFTDIKQRRGGKATGTFPFVLGVDVSGIVVDADPSSAIKVGDRVMAFVLDGSYKEVVRADERLVYSLPETISLRDAAAGMLTSILSEILLTQIAQVKLKDTIVIHSAAGGVGSMLIQLARLKGMTRLIATVGHADKIPYVHALGIQNVFTYNDFSEKVKELTVDKGADVIFDSVAGYVTRKSLDCLAYYGTLVQFGNSSGEAGELSTTDVHASCRTIRGFSLGTTRQLDPERIRTAASYVLTLFEENKLKMPMIHEFPLDEVQKAHRLMESRQYQGKIVLRIGGDEIE